MGTGRPAKDVFERWTPVWHAFFYVMIAVATALALWPNGNGAAHPRGERTLIVLLVAAVFAWHALVLARPGIDRERPRRTLVYLAGAIVLSGALVVIDPVFLMIAMTLYNQVFAFLPKRRALPVAIALSAVLGAIVMLTRTFASGWIVAIGAGSALLFAHFLSASADENRKRRELIDTLERTRAELAVAERRAGIGEERQRIARELHDTVTQQLVGIVMQLDDAAARAHAGDGRYVQTAIERSRQLAREGLAEARRLVWSERPRELEAGSLTRALHETLDAFAADGVEAERMLDGDLDALPPGVQTLVFRGVQEALANVRKHARARRVSVTAVAEGDRLLVDVQDDGIGFDAHGDAAPRDDGSGFGLRGLRERVEVLGGSLAVESEKGSGTTVGFQVPIA